MLPRSLNALFSFRCLINLVKPWTTENTENKATPKFCKNTVTKTLCRKSVTPQNFDTSSLNLMIGNQTLTESIVVFVLGVPGTVEIKRYSTTVMSTPIEELTAIVQYPCLPIWHTYLTDNLLQSLHAVATQDKPELESAKSPTERNLPMLYSKKTD